MPRVIDMFGSLPTPERVALEIRSWGNEPGYLSMFGERWSGLLGIDRETLASVAGLPAEDFLREATARLSDVLPPASHFVEEMKRAGMRAAVIHRPLPVDVPVADESTAQLVEEFPDFVIGFARVDLAEGAARAAVELRRSAEVLGLRGATLTPFWHGVSCSDPSVEPVLATAEELGIPLWIHTSMHWRRSVPLEVEHPRHIDEVAGRHPDLRIVCGHGGWPWVQEMVAVAWRHPHVYIDVSAFRPRNVFQEGSGWEALIRFGAKVIPESVVFGSTWSLLGRTPEQAVTEAAGVPWPDRVKEQWLYANAAKLLDVEDP